MRRVMDITKETGGAVRVNCGTEQVPMASEVYELQLTLYRHSETSNGCDEMHAVV